MAQVLELEVEAEAAGQRIDVFLVMKGVVPSRSFGQKLIDDNQVLVNHRPVKSSHKLMGGERVVVEIPPRNRWQWNRKRSHWMCSTRTSTLSSSINLGEWWSIPPPVIPMVPWSMPCWPIVPSCLG